MSTATWLARPDGAYRHEALFYADGDDFLGATAGFLKAGIAAGEASLVVVSAEKIRWLRAALGADADAVFFADMAGVGANPARIIPAWHRFVDGQRAAGRRMRGIGEPIWASRTPDELVECQRHEDLLNVAFVDAPGFWLLCPYDLSALPRDVLDEAERSHPYVTQGGSAAASATYRGLDAFAAPFATPLAPPPDDAVELPFDARRLEGMRGAVAVRAEDAGFTKARRDDLALAVYEVVVNSVRHGGGGGILRMWNTPEAVVCEVEDGGHIDHPLAGREAPPTDSTGGRGLWLVNHLCDLVQLRSSLRGTVIRMHMWRR